MRHNGCLFLLMLAADFWNEWRVSAAVACCGDGFDDEQYWEDPESGSGMDDWESGGPNQARPKRISQASRWEKGTCGMRGSFARMRAPV